LRRSTQATPWQPGSSRGNLYSARLPSSIALICGGRSIVAAPTTVILGVTDSHGRRTPQHHRREEESVMGQLSQAFIEARERVGWSHRELARRAGCRNLVSQSRLIHQFEMGSAVDYRLLLKIGRVLGFTQQRIDELIAEDEA